MKNILIAALLLLSAGVSQADSVWTYTGNTMNGVDGPYQFTGCACSLSGSLVLSDTFQPLSWSFTDGTHSLNSSDSSISFNTSLPSQPGSPALFAHWYLDLVGAGVEFVSVLAQDHESAGDSVTVNGSVFGIEAGNPGSWVDPISTPEPSSLLLLAAGLTIASFGRLRLKRLA